MSRRAKRKRGPRDAGQAGGNGVSPGSGRTGPLSGIRVVEFGRFITAPYASRMLGDLGADVVKIEIDAGDPFRGFGDEPEFSASFLALNRNKRSVLFDPRSPQSVEDIRRVIDQADVFIENSRPGAMDRLGLDHVSLRSSNPGLVYCSITGAGREGPYAQRPAYDLVGQGLSGLASQFIDPANPTVSGPNLSDSLTGMTAAYGILSALVWRASSGKGQWVEVDMISSSLAFLGLEAQNYFESGEVYGPRTRPANSSSFVARCADNRLIGVHVSSMDKFWHGLTRALGRPTLAQDPRFATRAARVRNYEDLRQILQEAMLGATRDEWKLRLASEDVPYAPVHNIREVFEDEDLSVLKLQRHYSQPVRSNKTVSIPVRFSETGVDDVLPPPALGEHTAEVVRETRSSSRSAPSRSGADAEAPGR